MKRILLVLLAVNPALGGVPQAAPAADPDGVEFFEKRIRPVLVERCYSCHAEGAKAIKGGLRLDTRELTLKGGDSGAAVVPGDPDKSLLIRAVRFTDEELQMPPKKKLPPEIIADLEAWVRRGAPDPRTGGPAVKSPDQEKAARHWAFQAPKEPALPAVKNAALAKSPIDAFVLARLEEAGFKLQPAADKRTLLRRAFIDLVGLPPAAAELEAFEADASPDAFAKQVDALLARPAYGERWARHWMDVSRYSDTKGYTFQEERRFPYSYTYRDWLIRAFNDDLPYDKFLTYQVAADRMNLAGAEQRHLAAMGFLTLGRRFLNRIPDIIDDRLDVLFRGTQGVSVGCARCHDHKFDPISTKDYYSLYGVFASSIEPKDLPLIQMGEKSKENLAYEQEIAKLQGEVQKFRETRHKEITAKLREVKSVAAYLEAAQEARGLKDDELRKLAEKRDLFAHVLTRWRDLLDRTAKTPDPVWIAWHALAAPKPGVPAGADPRFVEAFKTPPTSLKDAAARYAAVLVALKALDAEGSPPNPPFAELDRVYTRADRDKQKQLENKVQAVQVSHPGAPSRAMVLQDGPIHEPHVFIRGNPNSLGEKVPRQFLSILSGPKREPFKDGSGRLDLVRQIASKENPLTARVLVNRVWAEHFGRGLVPTPSDFGLRNDPPSHPALLDWLALRFMEDGWSVKKLHRRILLSAAWQQRSDDVPAAREKDPENTLLWRQNRRRLDFEAMRDSMLSVSGLLDPAMGGRPVQISENPTAQQKMQAETIVNTVGDPGQERSSKRRSVYLYIDRQNLPNTFRNFDFASPDTHSPQRFITTVPQQALFLMNSPFAVELAVGLIQRPEVVRESDVEQRIAALYRTVYGRAPSAAEQTLGRAYLEGEERSGPALAAGPSGWQQGYGSYDEASKRLKSFTALPHFEGGAWQGGRKMPDPKLGWLLLTAEGGHPGAVAAGATVRRWVAPKDAVVSITGVLAHRQAQGDGVRARIASSRLGELASWTAHNTEAETAMSRVEVKAGDFIDFIVDCRGEESFDSFAWAPVIRTVETATATGASPAQEWSAAKGFRGPEGRARKALGSWERYAQALLLANEFMFVD